MDSKTPLAMKRLLGAYWRDLCQRCCLLILCCTRTITRYTGTSGQRGQQQPTKQQTQIRDHRENGTEIGRASRRERLEKQQPTKQKKKKKEESEKSTEKIRGTRRERQKSTE